MKIVSWILFSLLVVLSGCTKHDEEMSDSGWESGENDAVEFNREAPREVVVQQEKNDDQSTVADAQPVSTAQVTSQDNAPASKTSGTEKTSEAQQSVQAALPQASETKIVERTETSTTVVSERYVIVRGGSRQFIQTAGCATCG